MHVSLSGRSQWHHRTVNTRTPETYRDVAEAAWSWVLAQVRWDDGPWIPGSVTTPATTDIPADRDGMHSGIGGLAHVLAEIRLARPWTAPEQDLADGIAQRIRSRIAQVRRTPPISTGWSA